MSYQTIAVHVDSSIHAPARIRLAAQLAWSAGAHLIGVAMTGVSRFAYPPGASALARTALEPYTKVLFEQADHALAAFDSAARAQGLPHFERRLLDDDPAGGLLQLAPYCDLIIAGQVAPDEPASSATAVPELVLVNCARPLLVVPYAGPADRIDGRALVAWDGSIEATRALTGALPLLRRAEDVVVAVFRSSATEVAEHANELLAWLFRHRVTARTLAMDLDIHAGDALLQLAKDEQSDLMVMGAYGHTRFREHLLGGVTAAVLREMTIPVLMAH
jgi:nucleotide-binding universal stress UspA family protein